MAEVNYAIEINTGVAVNVPQLGHTNDGYMRLITGRPGYDGTPTYPTWEDTTNNTHVWYEGILLKNGISSPTRMVDIKQGGNYATVSGMTVTLTNANTLWDYLGNNDIYLANRVITLYVVIDDVFYGAFSGVVTDTSYSETRFTINCRSDYRKIHKTIPPNSINKAIYPESTTDDTIPVVLGHVSYVKMFSTGNSDTKTVADYDIDGNPVYRCSFNSYVAYDYIALLTINKAYLANELSGKFLRTVTGTNAETDRIIQILSNDASTVGSAGGITNYYETKVYISESFDTDQTTVNTYSYSWLGTKTSVGDTWWFEILDAKTEFIISNNPVQIISKDDYNQTILNYYNEDTGKTYDAHGLITSIGTNKNRDSIKLIRTEENKSGQLTNAINHGASVATVDASGGLIYSNFINVSIGNSGNMVDIDRSTETDNILSSPFQVSPVFHPSTPGPYTDIVFDVDCSNFDLRDAENICIGLDMELVIDPDILAASPFNFGVGWNFRLVDTFGRVVILTPDMGVDYSYEQQCAAFPTQTTLDYNFLPNDYYKLGDDNSETSIFGEEDGDNNQVRDYLFLPDALVEMLKKDNAYKVRVILKFGTESLCNIDSIKIKQLGVFSYQILETDKEKLYVKVYGGEMYDVTTNTRSCYNSVRHILENYDGISSSDIDYNNLPTTRTNSEGWTLGRQIFEPKNSIEYLRDICKYYFLGMFTDRNGVLNVSAFKEKTTVVETFDSSNTIRDSIRKMLKSPILNVYNEFVLKWGYNDGTEGFDKVISINGVDEATAFPGFLTDDTDAAATQVVSPNITSCDYYSTGSGLVVFDASITSTLYVDDSITIYLTSGGVETSKVIYFAKITKIDSDTIYFDKPLIQTTTSDYETGITNLNLYKHSSGSNVPLWMNFVQGIEDYSTAKTMWESCQESYEQTNVVKAYPDLECKWFIDDETFYGVDEMFYGHSPMQFLSNFIDWMTVQKDIVTFRVPITTDMIVLNLLDYVSFEDEIITLDIARNGWITKTKIDTVKNEIELELTLIPGGYTEMGDIIESGGWPDDIEESGSQPDEIVEGT